MKKSIEIIPAVLPKDFFEIEEKIGLVKGLVKNVQVDICDGGFVPNATWPYKKSDDTFKKLLSEDEGMPFWENVNYEFDLMVNRPEEVVDDWVRAGASRIIVHRESKGDPIKALEILQGRVEVGMAFNIDTIQKGHDTLFEIFHSGFELNFIQLMGIDRIGFQGQEFDERVLGCIKEIHIPYPGIPISVDGGVSLETAPKLIDAGADRLVVGSAIFGSDNPIEAVHKFKAL